MLQTRQSHSLHLHHFFFHSLRLHSLRPFAHLNQYVAGDSLTFIICSTDISISHIQQKIDPYMDIEGVHVKDSNVTDIESLVWLKTHNCQKSFQHFLEEFLRTSGKSRVSIRHQVFDHLLGLLLGSRGPKDDHLAFIVPSVYLEREGLKPTS